jgi:hypothetical protein
MPRCIRIRFHVDNLPESSMSANVWLAILSRDDLIRMHEWAEPWPLLWTLSDREVVEYCRRYHSVGPSAFWGARERQREADAAAIRELRKEIA